MPYIWTKIYDDKNGVTFHLVNNKIDSGKILLQKIYDKNFYSMIDFYIYIFESFPNNFIQAIYNFKKKNILKIITINHIFLYQQNMNLMNLKKKVVK